MIFWCTPAPPSERQRQDREADYVAFIEDCRATSHLFAWIAIVLLLAILVVHTCNGNLDERLGRLLTGGP